MGTQRLSDPVLKKTTCFPRGHNQVLLRHTVLAISKSILFLRTQLHTERNVFFQRI